jgi:hypothetical protein
MLMSLRKDNLDPVLARIAGAAHNDLHHDEVLDREAVPLERRDFTGEPGDDVHHLGTLQGHHGGLDGLVVDGEGQLAGPADILEVPEEFLAVAGVDHDEEIILVHAVHDHIVTDSTRLVADQRIAALAGLHIADAARA